MSGRDFFLNVMASFCGSAAAFFVLVMFLGAGERRRK